MTQEQPVPQSCCVIIVGPSGVGKTTAARALINQHPTQYKQVIGMTSRPMREGEKDGVDYHFVDRQTMQTAIDNGDVFEHVEYNGNLYGMSHSEIQSVFDEGKNVIAVVNEHGADVYNEHYDCLPYLLVPPNDETLEKRLRGRGTDSEEVIEQRLQSAQTELSSALSKTVDDGLSFFRDVVVSVDDINQVVNAIHSDVQNVAECEHVQQMITV